MVARKARLLAQRRDKLTVVRWVYSRVVELVNKSAGTMVVKMVVTRGTKLVA